MLSLFRRGFMAKIMLVILVIGLIAIVITGFGTGGSGMGGLGGMSGTTVASVGSEKLSSARLTDEAQRQLTRLRREQPELDMVAFLQQGALEEVLDQLIDLTGRRCRQQQPRRSRRYRPRHRGIPAFHDLTGRFDDSTFRAALAQENITEQQLREEFEARLLQRQLLGPVARSAHVPNAIANQYASLLLESRTGIVGAVPSAAVGDGTEPSEAELAASTDPPAREPPGAALIPYTSSARRPSRPSQATEPRSSAYDPTGFCARENRRLSQRVLPRRRRALGAEGRSRNRLRRRRGPGGAERRRHRARRQQPRGICRQELARRRRGRVRSRQGRHGGAGPRPLRLACRQGRGRRRLRRQATRFGARRARRADPEAKGGERPQRPRLPHRGCDQGRLDLRRDRRGQQAGGEGNPAGHAAGAARTPPAGRRPPAQPCSKAFAVEPRGSAVEAIRESALRLVAVPRPARRRPPWHRSRDRVKSI